MLRVKELTCFRIDRALFKPVSFSLNEGEILQVCGPNGSGKTTLMRTLVGLYKNYTGCFSWDLSVPPLYLGHKPAINANLTPRENIKWGFEVIHQSIGDADIDKVICEIGLADSANPLFRPFSRTKKASSLSAFLSRTKPSMGNG